MSSTTSVCLERKFEELNSMSREELENEALSILNGLGYLPSKIEFGTPNKGVVGEIRIPVEFNENEAMNNWLFEAKKKNADLEFENYLFGEDVEIIDDDNWDTNDSSDFTKIVYYKDNYMEDDGDSRKISFHVKFESSSQPLDAYAYDMNSGNNIGERREPKLSEIMISDIVDENEQESSVGMTLQ